MRKGLKIFLIVLAIIVVLAAAGAAIILRSTNKLEQLKDMSVEDVDLASIPNGTYEGRYSAFPVSVIVEVTVRDGAITGIELVKHVNGQGGAAEAIPSTVIEKQSLQVDVVSGATYSSKVILLAIENALETAGSQ
jgi:uncharacterized protein with FMN-binding domain